MKTHEQYGMAHFSQPGAVEDFSRKTFGMPTKDLERHLQIMQTLAIPGRGIGIDDRRWLLSKSKAAGRDLRQAAADIARVSNIVNPETRLQAYVRASGGDALPQSAVDYAVGLAKRYNVENGVMMASDRLAQRDADRRKFNSGELPDAERFQADRKESGAVRHQIENALRDRGLIESAPRSLDEAQHRARAAANRAADQLELTSYNPNATRHDQVRAVVDAAEAFGKMSDTGVSDDDLGVVYDRTTDAIQAAKD